MKIHAAVLVMLLTMLAVKPVAQSQAHCTSPVLRWLGKYTLSGTGSGKSADGFTYKVNESAAANVYSTGPIFFSCSKAIWFSDPDRSPTASINDSGVASCDPGDPKPQQTIAITDVAPYSGTTITVDTSAGIYSFLPNAGPEASVKAVDCNGDGETTDIGAWVIGPVGWVTSAPGPPTFTLPETVQGLSTTGSKYLGTWAWGSLSIPWTLSFSIDPTIDTSVDDPCEWIAGSSIGCQNQSLEEDIPLVGTGFYLHYESDRLPGTLIASSAAGLDVAGNGGWTLNVHHIYDGAASRLYLGDGNQRSLWQMGQFLMANGNYLFTSKDGSEVYVFDGTTGNHIQTVKPFTGALKYKFAYDSSNLLISITDANGNVTSITRGSNGLPTAVVSPYGQTTTLTMDANGYLSAVKDPAGHVQSFAYSPDGLMTSRKDASGNNFNYAYDSNGALTEDTNLAGGAIAVTSTQNLAAGMLTQTVTGTTAMGLVTSLQTARKFSWVDDGTSYSEQRVNTGPDGLPASESKTTAHGQITESTSLPSGRSTSLTEGPDPRWGIQAPVPVSSSIELGSLTMNITHSRTAALATAGNPFSLTSQADVETINGHAYKYAYTAANRTYTETSPVGRKLITVFDTQERKVSTQVPGLAATKFTYDSHGRVSSISYGTRKTTMVYNALGNVASVTDPLGQKSSFAYDADGNLIKRTWPDGRFVSYTHDANGNVLSVTPPSRTAHDFKYDSNGLPTGYTPPPVTGAGPLTYAYNLDQQLSSMTSADGNTITFNYDAAGRVSSVATPTTTTNYGYDSTTGLLASSALVGGETVAYSYAGPLLTNVAWTGTVAGSVGHTYNNNFHVTTRTINGASAIAYKYDNDGLMTGAGAMTLARGMTDGLLNGTTLGLATDSLTYDTFGDVNAYSATYNGAAVYGAQFTRNALGRITAQSETVGGVTTAYAYTFDTAGRLTTVSKNGTVVSTYVYDGNSNRTSAVTASGTANATFDAQDRQLTNGTTSYTYTPNGEVATQTSGGQVTSYQYDGTGNLISVTMPNGTKVNYILDGKNRRMGREVNGTLAQGFLYDGTHVVALLNSANKLVSQFVYASRANVPDYMLKAGVAYRIVTDHLGSPRLVVNTSTGQIAERIDYDEFGNVLADSSPGFQPFGFAGGLYDATTKLVHFGAREYATATGRWLTKDPILFSGGDNNLYGYALADPINLIDSDGNESFGGSAYNGVGVGITITTSGGHTSITIELGVGTPSAGVEHNPDAQAYTGDEMSKRTGDSSSLTIFGEGGVEGVIPVPGVGNVTLIDGKVGIDVEESPCPGKFKPAKKKGKICSGTECVGTEESVHQLVGDPFEQHGGHPEFGGSVKGGVKVSFPIN
jgi:RHS repeat-associated protein